MYITDDEHDELMRILDKMLYYDPEELWEAAKQEQAERIAVEKRNKEIATNMLKGGIDIDIICKITNLSLEELEKIKESM